MSGAPKEMERTPSADQATSQERRVSIVPATAAWPPTGAVVITYDTMGFGWWLSPARSAGRWTNFAGAALVVLLYTIWLFVFSKLRQGKAVSGFCDIESGW
jgi:hypothetical protein